jgi:hypothetical protein
MKAAFHKTGSSTPQLNLQEFPWIMWDHDHSVSVDHDHSVDHVFPFCLLPLGSSVFRHDINTQLAIFISGSKIQLSLRGSSTF